MLVRVEKALERAGQLLAGPIAQASVLSLTIKLTSLAMSFATAVLTARLLGPEGYGILAFALSIISILSIVSTLGMAPLSVRQIPALKASEDAPGLSSFLRLSLTFTLACSFVAALGLAAVAVFTELLPVEERSVMLLAALLVVPQTLLGLLANWSRGFGRIALAQIPNELLRPAVYLGLLLGFWVAGMKLGHGAFLLATLATALLALLVAAIWFWQKEGRRMRAEVSGLDSRETIRAGLPFLGITVVALLQGEINTLMLTWLSGPKDTGLFQPILRLMNLMMLGVTAAGMAYAPRIAELWQRGELETIRKLTGTFTLTTTVVTAAFAIGIAAVGPWLLAIFGKEFVEVAPLLWIVAAAQIFNSACGPGGLILMSSGFQALTIKPLIAGLGTNALLGAILFPHYGAQGAVVALSASVLVWNTGMVWTCKIATGITPELSREATS